MKVRNNTLGVINIDGKFILPAQTAEVGNEWAENKIVKMFITKGCLTVVKEENKVDVDFSAMETEFGGLSGESTKTALRAYAKKYGISVAGAETAEDMYAVIRAYVETAAKNA